MSTMKIYKKARQINVRGNLTLLAYLTLAAVMLISLFLIFYQGTGDKWDTLKSSDNDYLLEYPASWVGTEIKASRGADYLHGRINDNYLLPRSYMLIYTKPMSDPTFKEGTLWAEEILIKDCGYICWGKLEPKNVGVGDYLALTTTYEEKVSLGQTLYKEVVVIVASDRVYMLQFNTYDRSQSIEMIFNRILDSFEIVEAND